MRVVLDLVDGDNGDDALPFGKKLPDDVNKKDWLWEKRGRLFVISVPYRRGVHFAKKFSDFVPIWNHLKYLHENDRVHGDIRAFNIVFGNEDGQSTGWLIDLDFGGEAGKVCYPDNFNFELVDGTRLEPNTGDKSIQKSDDCYALWQVMTTVHLWSHSVPHLQEQELLVKFVTEFYDLESLFRKIENIGQPCHDQYSTKVQNKVSEFLKDWGEIELSRKRNFQMKIDEQLGTQPTTESEIAKTSPKKTDKTNEIVATGSLLLSKLL